MIRYGLYDPVSKKYGYTNFRSEEEAKKFKENFVNLSNPNKWKKSSKYYRKYKKSQDYYRRLVIKKAKIKWEPV